MTWHDDVDATEDDLSRWQGVPYPAPGEWEVSVVEFDGVIWRYPPMTDETTEGYMSGDYPELEAYLDHEEGADGDVMHKFDVWERDEGKRMVFTVTNPDHDELMRKCYTELQELHP